MSRQPFGGSEPLDIEAIRQSPRQFVDLVTVVKLSDYAMVCELKIERLLGYLKRYREETPLGHQPHMIAHLVDEELK